MLKCKKSYSVVTVEKVVLCKNKNIYSHFLHTTEQIRKKKVNMKL